MVKETFKKLLGYAHEESLLLHRSLIPLPRSLPDFLIIGMQKGGTTALSHFLNYHPSVKHPYRKEVCYFDQSHKRGLKYYSRFFPVSSGNKSITYDATPSYFPNKDVPARISKVLPNAKFVVCVRDPVERLLSHYRMSYKAGWETLGLLDALAAENARLETIRAIDMPMCEMWVSRFAYLNYSLYCEHLENWLEHFPLEQFHFVENNQMKVAPEQELKTLLRFLELPESADLDFFSNNFKKTVFSNADQAIADELPTYLCDELGNDFKKFKQRIS